MLGVGDGKYSITIENARFKGGKTDFLQLKTSLQTSIDDSPVLRGVKIRCLRELAKERRINIVFHTEEDAKKARHHDVRLPTLMLEARLTSEERYPVSCDMMAKRAVSGEESALILTV